MCELLCRGCGLALGAAEKSIDNRSGVETQHRLQHPRRAPESGDGIDDAGQEQSHRGGIAAEKMMAVPTDNAAAEG
jgi:hypothetical protein